MKAAAEPQHGTELRPQNPTTNLTDHLCKQPPPPVRLPSEIRASGLIINFTLSSSIHL